MHYKGTNGLVEDARVNVDRNLETISRVKNVLCVCTDARFSMHKQIPKCNSENDLLD